MATRARIKANRNNAKKSTGPRTEQGKTRVAKNALKHGLLAAAVADKRRLTEKCRPEKLRPGYDGETLLLGSAMLERTQAFVHLARYDGHLSRRFFRAVKQLADLRRDERKSRQTRSSANSHTPANPDRYPSPHVPAPVPPTTDTPSPTAGRSRLPGPSFR